MTGYLVNWLNCELVGAGCVNDHVIFTGSVNILTESIKRLIDWVEMLIDSVNMLTHSEACGMLRASGVQRSL